MLSVAPSRPFYHREVPQKKDVSQYGSYYLALNILMMVIVFFSSQSTDCFGNVV
jgi:hypothetical protein